MSDPQPRLASGFIVAALIRRVQAAGGFATILHRGDADAGGILIDCRERGQRVVILEKSTDFDGLQGWRHASDAVEVHPEAGLDYGQRRLSNDPDLWLIELDIADAERFAVETLRSA